MGVFDFLGGKSRFEKFVDKYKPDLAAINALSEEMKALSDDDLIKRVTQYSGKDFSGIQPHTPEIFAAIREAGGRILEMRHFDVQMLGGLSLLDGKIAEMKTGEGKTLMATLPLILRSLSKKGAHLVTVNDYLATRDAEWMKPLYEFFGLTVGVVVHGMTPEEKRVAYGSDITYGTNNEFGFDYLRDNMAQRVDDMVQGELAYVIIDEVDSILIDEARTPLIISAPDAESTELYNQFSGLVPSLKENKDYNIDEKRKAAMLTDQGITRVEKILNIENIYEEKGLRFVHHLEQALRANTLYHKDKDYVVKDGQVIIVDEFTGRLMEGRRYSEGLHQAIEAKEKVKVQQESRTLATITFQNFFRLYDSLSGMTGTAVTSAEEFEKVYNVEVAVIPTNKPLIRNDKTDKIFVNEEAKFKAIVLEIKERHEKGQPVLVGTIAIEKSERLAAYLQREGVPHEVLNAKHHAREAEIVSNAGQKGAVTIATNMAGRGTDIKLGDGVVDRGGLFILGTERHEARRIDNQLRGRSGRQGDPGDTQFFVSLDDDVMRVFGGDKIKGIMQKLKLPEDEPIENRLVSNALGSSQERVEGYYFDMRKQVLSYDDVLNKQRMAIYTLRRGILIEGKWKEKAVETENLNEHIKVLTGEMARALVDSHTGEIKIEDWNSEEIAEGVSTLIGEDVSSVHSKIHEVVQSNMNGSPEVGKNALIEVAGKLMVDKLKEKEESLGDHQMQHLEIAAAMRAIDTHWMEHLDTMDYLRTGIGLRGYGQRDPLVEYQKEGFLLFQRLMATIKSSTVETVFRAQPTLAESSSGTDRLLDNQRESGATEGSNLHQIVSGQKNESNDDSIQSNEPIINPNKDIGRNDPCPCRSGKKYKKCGMINAPEHKAS